MKNQYPFYTLCLALTMLTACSGEKKESAFTDHNGIPVVLEDMVEGLPFQDQRGDDRIQMPDFIFGKRDPFPCL